MFVFFLVGPWLIWYGIVKQSPSLQKAFTHELKENRNTYDFDDGVENYFNDRIPFRSYLVHSYNLANHALQTDYKNTLEKRLIARWYDEEEEAEKVMEDVSEYEWLVYGSNESDDVMDGKDHIHDYVLEETKEPTFESYGYTAYRCNVCNKVIKNDYVAKKVDTSYFSPVTSDTFVTEGRFDWLFLFDSVNHYDIYQGKNNFADDKLEEYCAIYSSLQEECEKRGIKFILLEAPAKYQVYDEYLPTMEVENDYKRIPQLRDYLAKHSDVKMVYPLSELQFGDRYYSTYFRYDSHWNQVGAYVALQSLYHELGLPVTPLSDVEISLDTKEETKCKDLIGMGGYEESDFSHPDYNYIVDYKPDIHATNVPTEPKWEMDSITETTSDAPRKEHFVMVGDSFRCMMAPYIAKDFDRSSFILFYCWDKNHVEERGLDYDEVMTEIGEDILDADYLVIEATENNTFYQVQRALLILDFLQNAGDKS